MAAIRREFTISKKDDAALRKAASSFSFKEKTKLTNFKTDPLSASKQEN